MAVILQFVSIVIGAIVGWHVVSAAAPQFMMLWWVGILFSVLAAVARVMEDN